MKSIAEKIYEEVFTRNAVPIRVRKVGANELGVSQIRKMILARIERDGDLLESVVDVMSHI